MDPFQPVQKKAEHLLKELFPICRSLTGDGNRATFEILNRLTPLTIHSVRSGTEVFDWKVPPEWNVVDAWVKDANGNKIIDFKKNNLHLVGYSHAVQAKVRGSELMNHLHTLPKSPSAIPYRTSYYKRDWGFCVSYEEYIKIKPEIEYDVFIDSTHNENGVYFMQIPCIAAEKRMKFYFQRTVAILLLLTIIYQD